MESPVRTPSPLLEGHLSPAAVLVDQGIYPPVHAKRPTLVTPDVFLTRIGVQPQISDNILKERRVVALDRLKALNEKIKDLDNLVQTVCENAAHGQNQLELEALGNFLKEKKDEISVPFIAILSYLLILKLANQLHLTETTELLMKSFPYLSTPEFQGSDLESFQFNFTPSWMEFIKCLLTLGWKHELLQQAQLEDIILQYIGEKEKKEDLKVGFLLLLLFCNQEASSPFDPLMIRALRNLFAELWENDQEGDLTPIFGKFIAWANRGLMGRKGSDGVADFLKGFYEMYRGNFPRFIQSFLPVIKKHPETCSWMIQHIDDTN